MWEAVITRDDPYHINIAHRSRSWVFEKEQPLWLKKSLVR
jgi:hypothetical protein